MIRSLAQDCDHVAQGIVSDQIDILVDLAGHTSGNRLAMFALKPAPTQVTWLGYPNTTGLRTIDYRLTDSIADPAGSGDEFYTEKLVRLPRTAWDLVMRGKADVGGGEEDATPREVPDFGAILSEQLAVVQSRIDDVIP